MVAMAHVFATVYMFATDPARSAPLDPNAQAGWLLVDGKHREGVPPISIADLEIYAH